MLQNAIDLASSPLEHLMDGIGSVGDAIFSKADRMLGHASGVWGCGRGCAYGLGMCVCACVGVCMCVCARARVHEVPVYRNWSADEQRTCACLKKKFFVSPLPTHPPKDELLKTLYASSMRTHI